MGGRRRAGRGEPRARSARSRRLYVGLVALGCALAGCATGRPPVDAGRASHVAGPAAAAPRTHEVRRGETLGAIAKRHGIGVQDLRRANGLDPRADLRPGQQLLVPKAIREHVVRRGETLWRIARQHGSTVHAIQQANGIDDVTRVSVGQRLWVPAGLQPTATAERSAETWTSADRRGRAEPTGPFAWPVEGRVTSRFGMRRNHHHDGIDISAPPGTPVYAAAPGRVIHADASLAGYGNMIIVKHSGRYSTVYAHNRRLLVRVGEFVRQGQKIAEVGQTGRASSPHLHFEVRYDGRPRDPLGALR